MMPMVIDRGGKTPVVVNKDGMMPMVIDKGGKTLVVATEVA